MWLDLGEYSGPRRAHAFVMFCTYRTRRRNEEYMYRVYVTDSLQNIPQNKCLSKRYADIVGKQDHEEIDVDDVIRRVVRLVEETNDEPA